uniref:Uncharacterized protein n=1 Tax=Octopus bimaculoides TaxID=37653 RepID=A0A0L8FK90_OCTBM
MLCSRSPVRHARTYGFLLRTLFVWIFFPLCTFLFSVADSKIFSRTLTSSILPATRICEGHETNPSWNKYMKFLS